MENGLSQIMKSLLTLGNYGIFNHLDILGCFYFLQGCLFCIPVVPTLDQRSLTASLESRNHFLPALPDLSSFPLHPLPWLKQASWNLFLLCYFPEKQTSGDDDNNNNIALNIYWAALRTKLC